MQGIEHIWVDDPLISGPGLKQVFTDLETVLDDVFHWIQRILCKIPDGHPLKGQLLSPFAKLHWSIVKAFVDSVVLLCRYFDILTV